MRRKQATMVEWNLMLVAMAASRPTQVLEGLPRAITACGGWVLRHGTVSERCADIDFEFPRARAIDIYSLLLCSGMELSARAHRDLTALCHCTQHLPSEEKHAAARVQISLYTREAGDGFLEDQSGELPEAA